MPSALPSVPTEAFLACAERTLALAGRAEVRDAWERDSECEGMTVGGLAHHLVAQVRRTAELLATRAPGDARVIGLLDHYDQAPWVAQSRSGEVDPDQNDRDNEAAAIGPDAVLAQAQESLAELPRLLAEGGRPQVVHIPWQGWALPTDAFLTTRLMEMVVHGDDLAVSVGVETPEHDEAVTLPVLTLLAGVAARRHGQVAVLRGLSRPQRSTGDISAF
ncbi:hypothetical protein N802_19020 [Knoellia sinensis KCTC 19936]|uniref:Mycothiol-dependent maleylpyruvate isomerase metal-binding domain-containing protein n=1 Tax=Knoellia sinensis KCTC 19936 TaxID=1385520 RepID=A0A0A0J8A1_9MICO|nr:maleylpyruvate isomerase N-terminal domain-containing protein [Knoellia sinensis]KGN31861.1 hypothetical protein N802_19020 [Knoellia sinensis KCTC 19936]